MLKLISDQYISMLEINSDQNFTLCTKLFQDLPLQLIIHHLGLGFQVHHLHKKLFEELTEKTETKVLNIKFPVQLKLWVFQFCDHFHVMMLMM